MPNKKPKVDPARVEAERKVTKLTNILRQKGIPDDKISIHNTPAGQSRTLERVGLRTKPVCWAMPMDEVVFQDWVVNLWRMMPMPWDEILTVKDTYLPSARNKLHSQFVEEAESEWLFMLDSDVLPPPNFIEHMLQLHREDPRKLVLNGYYHVKGEPYEPVVYEYVGDQDADEAEKDGADMKGRTGLVHRFRQYTVEEENLRRNGKVVERVTGIGAGCMLMHREVAEAIGRKPYDMSMGGEDLVLCRKITEAGYDIWVDWSMACAHVGVAWA